MQNIIIVVAYILCPILVLVLLEKIPILKKAGAIFIIYLMGIIIGNINILPENSQEIFEKISSVSILLALPLLLFSINIKKWFQLAGKTLISLVLGLLSVFILVLIGYFSFHNKIDECWKIAGMLMGVYSGGTPNLAAIQKALSVNYSDYLLVNSFDLLFSAAYLMLLISFGYRLLN